MCPTTGGPPPGEGLAGPLAPTCLGAQQLPGRCGPGALLPSRLALRPRRLRSLGLFHGPQLHFDGLQLLPAGPHTEPRGRVAPGLLLGAGGSGPDRARPQGPWLLRDGLRGEGSWNGTGKAMWTRALPSYPALQGWAAPLPSSRQGDSGPGEARAAAVGPLESRSWPGSAGLHVGVTWSGSGYSASSSPSKRDRGKPASSGSFSASPGSPSFLSPPSGSRGGFSALPQAPQPWASGSEEALCSQAWVGGGKRAWLRKGHMGGSRGRRTRPPWPLTSTLAPALTRPGF